MARDLAEVHPLACRGCALPPPARDRACDPDAPDAARRARLLAPLREVTLELVDRISREPHSGRTVSIAGTPYDGASSQLGALSRQSQV
jgi:hypothetical protein